MSIASITDQSFLAEVETEGTVLVEFWASWCPPCKTILPVLEQLSEELPDLKIVKLNVDDEPETPGRFHVMSLPTMIVFKDGQAADKFVGFKSKDALKALVTRYL